MNYSDRILKEFDEHPVKCKIWADIMLKQIKTRLHEKELLQKYEHLTNEQLDRIYQLFDDTDS